MIGPSVVAVLSQVDRIPASKLSQVLCSFCATLPLPVVSKRWLAISSRDRYCRLDFDYAN